LCKSNGFLWSDHDEVEHRSVPLNGPAVTSPLPRFDWFAANPAAGHTRTGTRCAVFHAGAFYDNVFARERGGYTVHGSQKFDFNPGSLFHVDDAIGEVEEVNLNATGSDPSFIRQPMAFEAFRLWVSTVPGFTYVLERKDTLGQTDWQPLLPGTQATGTILELNDADPPRAQRFYRMHVE
jgi:hypothetical protein